MKLNSIYRESIGGAHALNLKTYLYITPIAILLSPLLFSNISDRRVATLWLVSSALAYGVLLVWIALARLVLVSYYQNKNFPIWSLVIVGAVAGLIRQTLTNLFASFYGLDTSATNSVLQNGLLGSLSWMFIVPLLAALTNSLYRLNTFHQEATSTLLQVEATKFNNQEAILKVKATAREQVENELSDLLSVTRQQILNFQHEPLEVQFEKISKVLTQSAIEIVRPLSHQLSTDMVHVDSRLRFRDVVTESLRSNPFLVWSNSFLIAFGTFLTISREKLSITSTVIVCFLQFAVVSCAMYLARRAQRRTKNYGILLLVFIDVLITYISWSLMNRYMDDYLFLLPQRLFVNFLWVLIVVVGTGFLSNFVNIKDGATNIVLRTIDEGQFNILLLESELQQTKNDIARYLHGNLQSRMMALSLTLDMAKDKSSKDELASALSIADSLLLSPFADYVQTDALPLKEEVEKVVSRWAGLLVISTKIEDIDDKVSQYQSRAIGATIEEAIGNSLRHGFAKSVWIRVFESDSDIIVEVIDDGVGPRSHVAGMGSRLYDAVASKGWSLQFRVEGTGSILSLRL